MIYFGTEQDTYSDEYKWLSHSIIPTSSVDKNPRITAGNEQRSQAYSASLLNISAMSFGALSVKAVEASNKGAKPGGYYHDTGEGGISPYHLKHKGDLVWENSLSFYSRTKIKGGFDYPV